MKRTLIAAFCLMTLATWARPADAQYAVGHRSFGAGTVIGGGFMRMDFKFPGVDASKPLPLLPTIELKAFLSDTLSIDVSLPVSNIAASNALQDYFFVTGDAFLNFHASAPSSVELFVAPGIGFSYASWEGSDNLDGQEEDGYAFHVPVRVGFEINNQRRNFSLIVAVRPFFSLVHGGTGNRAGGGGFVELGLMAYSVKHRADRY